MKFDIHGNDLRKGYCEVHPHVNQEYPCDICCRDKQGNSPKNNYYKNSIFAEQENTVRVVIETLIVRFPKSELDAKIVDVDFDGHYMIRIQKDLANGTWFITNAMNGYGNNCFDDFKNSTVFILS